MHTIVITLIFSIFTLDFFALQLRVIPRVATWLPELLSMLVMAVVLAQMGRKREQLLPGKYKLFLLFFLLNIVVGIAINLVSPGALISGIRVYLKCLPFFILPFVFQFSDRQIRSQVRLVLFFMVLQVPVALFQRLIQHPNSLTGDIVMGTIGSSSVLTVILAASVALLMSFFLTNRVKKIYFLMLIPAFLIPMTLNETKSSIVFIPIAIFGPLLLANAKPRMIIPVLMMGSAALVAFIVVYDAFMRPRWGYGLLDFFAMEGRAENYLYKGVEAGSNIKVIGKMDSYFLALQVLSTNFISLLFGLGIGNVTSSFIPGLEGAFYEVYRNYGVGATALSLLMWETGIVGAALYFLFMYMIFRDAMILRKQKSFLGSFSAGWAVVIVIMGIVIAYTNFIPENVIAYFFWYFSGVVAAKRFQWQKESRKRRFEENVSSQSGMLPTRKQIA